MITAAEARRLGPIADYIALSHALEKLIWQGIYARQTQVDIANACIAASMELSCVDERPWFGCLVAELEALGYEVSAEGVVSW